MSRAKELQDDIVKKKQHKEVVDLLKSVTDSIELIPSPLEEVEVSNFPNENNIKGEVKVSNLEDIEPPIVKEINIDKLVKAIEIGGKDNIKNNELLVRTVKEIEKVIDGYDVDLDKYTNKKNALAVKLVTADGSNFYTAISSAVSNGLSATAQSPLPVDGDSVYVKDLIEAENDEGTFTGELDDLFNGFSSGLIDSSTTNPKYFEFHLNRPQTTGTIGIVANTGNFSNVKILFKDRQDNIIQTLDDSSNNTKYNAFRYPVIAKNFCCIRIEFHTIDQVNVDFLRITKDLSVIARLKAIKPDGTETEINSTTAGNLKVSVEEIDSGSITKDIEAKGKTLVGDETTVQLSFTGTTTSILITADIDNTGMLYIGKSDVTANGLNSITFLQAGDALSIDYNDVDNPLHIIASVDNQNFWVGASI